MCCHQKSKTWSGLVDNGYRQFEYSDAVEEGLRYFVGRRQTGGQGGIDVLGKNSALSPLLSCGYEKTMRSFLHSILGLHRTYPCKWKCELHDLRH